MIYAIWISFQVCSDVRVVDSRDKVSERLEELVCEKREDCMSKSPQLGILAFKFAKLLLPEQVKTLLLTMSKRKMDEFMNNHGFKCNNESDSTEDRPFVMERIYY